MIKGNMFTENFTEIIIAMIGLVLLGLAVWQVYQVTVNSEVTAAKRMMDSLEGKVNALQVGEEGKFTFQGPCKDEDCAWFLTGWDGGDADRPEVCYFKSCLCACKGDYTKRTLVCNQGAVCRTFGFEDLSFAAMTLETIPGGSAGQTAPIPQRSHPVYQFVPNLNVLRVNRTMAGIEVYAG